jgi:hypothetical protein
MKDVNSALLQAYYEIIDNLNIPVFAGEEPDDVKNKVYVVLNDIVSNDTSTDNSSDLQSTIQININSWEYKYNNVKSVNDVANQIYQAIKPTSNSILDLSSFGLQMMNLSIQTDRTERFGEIANKVFITRIIIFKQDIFVIS